MGRYKCVVCGFVYDPEEGDPHSGIDPDTDFSNLPDDYKCPVCGAGKQEFFAAD
jgi:rubredoxin